MANSTLHTGRSGPDGPVSTGERSGTLDVLRGFAMLGILLVNLELFRGGYYSRLAGDVSGSTADRVVEGATFWLAQSKFISAFAFLFGVGAAIQLRRAAARGESATGRLVRRYLVLLAIGLVHSTLVWHGDILFVYALLGLGLLAFSQVSARTALGWGIGVLVLTALVPAVLAGAPDGRQEFWGELQAEAVAAYNHGGFLDQTMQRLADRMLAGDGYSHLFLMAFGLMLIGLAAGKSGLVDRAGERRTLLRRFAVVGLLVGVPVNGLLAAFYLNGGLGGLELHGLHVPLEVLGAPLLGLAYLALVTLACQRPAVLARLAPLAAVGRMALSAYLLQSLICVGVVVGFGLYGEISPVQGLALIAAVWAIELVLCPLWLRYFRMGPVEWAWRALTYGTRPAFRIAG